MMERRDTLQADLDRLRSRSLLVAGVCVLILLAGWLFNPEWFFRSYLFAYLFWLGISVGSLAILMLHHMVGGGWGFVIRRILEAATRTIPVMALLFIPLLLGTSVLYEWARPEAAHDALLQQKASYLNVPFFIIRAVIYFGIWSYLAHLLNRLSAEQDETGDPALTRKLQVISGPGLLLYGATVTFSSIDWGMSLEPHWFSSIYGVMFMVGQALSTLAFAVLVLQLLSRYEPLAGLLRPKHFHDLGNLMLAFTMLWAYMSFSQYLITWSGNLPEEISWYLHRTQGGWQYIGLLLILFHFALPFVLLLSRTTKRRARMLSAVAAGLLLFRLVDLFWLVVPAFGPGMEDELVKPALNVQFTDLFAPLAIGGIWVAVFVMKLRSRALLPVNDPRLAESFGHEEATEHG